MLYVLDNRPQNATKALCTEAAAYGMSKVFLLADFVCRVCNSQLPYNPRGGPLN
jgi:hypothetical protein